MKPISDNRNNDICVADSGVGAVVVVNQVGISKLRLILDTLAIPHPSRFNQLILMVSRQAVGVSDWNIHCIQILVADGEVLRYIDNCDLKDPWGLCVDRNDSFYVCKVCNVNRIRFSKYTCRSF